MAETILQQYAGKAQDLLSEGAGLEKMRQEIAGVVENTSFILWVDRVADRLLLTLTGGESPLSTQIETPWGDEVITW